MFRWVVCAIALSLWGNAGAAWARDWDFEKSDAGALPEHWKADKTGEGTGSAWEVREMEGAPSGPKVLEQTSSQGPRPLFNLCICEETSADDVDITVAVKPISGEIDRGGGPVWRLKDANNYYVARFNPLEDNFRVYKVVDGKREQLDTADVKLPAGKWVKIRVTQVGDHIRCWLNGKPLLEAHDKTLTAGGKIGLWTKADAVTAFDALSLTKPEEKDAAKKKEAEAKREAAKKEAAAKREAEVKRKAAARQEALVKKEPKHHTTQTKSTPR